MGDFNISEYILRTPSRNYNYLQHFINFFNLEQYNYILNVNNRLLDLILSNLSCSVQKPISSLLTEDSHHPALCINVCVQNESTNKFPLFSHESFNFKKANFPALYSDLALVDWSSIPDLSVNEAVVQFYDKIYCVFNKHVPKKIPSHKQYPPWFNSNIIRLLKQKDRARHVCKKTNDQDDRKNFNELRTLLKMEIRDAYAGYIRDSENAIKSNPNKFWSFINSKRNSTSIPSVMNYNNAVLENPQDIVNSFADFFSEAFINSSTYLPGNNLNNNNVIHIRMFSESEVLNAIKKLKANMTTGPDKVPAFIIRDCASVFYKPLCMIFNLILSTETFPDKWKQSRICPVFKKGSKNEIENHRPIAILCNFSKIFEFLLHDYVSFHTKSTTIEEQHGFMGGRSTVTNLVCVTQFISEALDRKSQVDIIYTDFSKAFDRLDHGILLSKLENFGIGASLLKLFRSYLSHRFQYVQYRGYQSDQYTQTSGVPQGSILGPLFFVLFINDIVDNLDVHYLLYADDLKLYFSINSDSDCLRVQRNLDLLNTWCINNRLPLNAAKCNVMSFTRKVNPISFNYNLNNCTLSRPEYIKDLGVTFDPKLTFTKHIEECTSGAFKSLGFILRNSKDFTELSTLRSLFVTFVRSKLEYASIVWSPNYNTHISSLEKVQRRFFKSSIFILEGTYPVRGTPQELFLNKFEISSLIRRRIMHSIIFLYKIINNKINCACLTSLLRFRIPRINSRTNNVLMLPTSRTNILETSPLHQMCLNYNSIEDSLDIFNCKITDIKNIYLKPI